MADASAEKGDKAPESPTTAQPLDFDDDSHETGIAQGDGPASTGAGTPKTKPRSSSRVHFAEAGDDETPPPKPPRPGADHQQSEATLIEAFPTVDPKVVKAVLTASRWQLEPAFNALLSMSDPNYVDEQPPPQPPRPTAQQRQLEQDELYARQLAEHYDSGPRNGGQSGNQFGGQLPPQPPRGQQDREHSFFDDDLPEIRENIRKGFLETQSTVNKWISDFRKRIDGDDDEGVAPVAGQGTGGQRQNFGASTSEQLHAIQRAAEQNRSRRSTDHERYDADPQLLSDNFTELEMRDEEAPPPKPARPQANPNLFKPTPALPSGPVDEVDAAQQRTAAGAIRQSSPLPGSKSKKWQPLTSVAPNPEGDDNEHDPFALGDSDDEKDKATGSKSVDVREADTARLKRSASEAEGTGADQKVLQESELTGTEGTRNKEVEALLEGAGK